MEQGQLALLAYFLDQRPTAWERDVGREHRDLRHQCSYLAWLKV